ncbi:MAG TPA: hemolysin family protein [Bryobacteraceae bacterium]|nr:hemolysin family protein [Bryobacteraceae bacterium]
MIVAIPLLLIALLILLNAIYVAAEFSIVSAPRLALEQRAAAGYRMAQRVTAILRDPRRQDQYIATAQVGITLASIGLGMYGEEVLAHWFSPLLERLGPAAVVSQYAVASVLAITTLTYFHIVLGEMVPKSLALQSAGRVVLWITPLVVWTRYLLYPLVMGLYAIGDRMTRIAGIDRQAPSQHHFYTPEELAYVIEESEEGGQLRAESGEVLRQLLRFDELTAGEVMVPRVRVAGLPLEAPPDELRRVLRESRHTRFPVYRQTLDHVVGYVHIKDLLPKILEHRPVQEADVRPVPFVPETATLDKVLAIMRRTGAPVVIVMDEHGGTAGVLTMKDLLDEVVGEVQEDAEEPAIRKDPDGSLHVKGTVRVDELADELDVTIEQEDVDTVSGLVLSLLERPPEVGDAVIYQGLCFEVTAVEGHGVKTCRITASAP